jgi:hypothetical protein
MSVLIQGDQIRSIALGIKVTGGAKTLPATTTGSIFTVTGGRVLVTSLTGVVTTACGATATNLRIVATPSGSGSVNDLSGDVAVTSLGLGGLISITGLAADAAVKSTGGGVSGLRNPITVAAGAIGAKTDATDTGAITWTLTYVPIDNGATVTAA